MSPPTVPPIPDDTKELARIVIYALRDRGYDAGEAPVGCWWKDYDIQVLWWNITIGSKIKNRSWLELSWKEKRIIKVAPYGQRFDGTATFIDMADPNALTMLVDLIVRTSTEDVHKYPHI